MVAMEEQSGRPELVENTHASKRTRIPVRGSARGGWVCALCICAVPVTSHWHVLSWFYRYCRVHVICPILCK